MTSNEKKVLVKFKEVKQANTVTMAALLRSSINYGYDVCRKLCEKGYLEMLSPGRFALYKITPLGEEQFRGEGQTKKEMTESPVFSQDKLREGISQPASSPSAMLGINSVEGSDSVRGKIEEIEEYECVSCGAAVEEDNTECPRCGIVFEEGVEEEEATKSFDSSRDEGVPPPPLQSPIHPSVPEDWKTCNWKWKK